MDHKYRTDQNRKYGNQGHEERGDYMSGSYKNQPRYDRMDQGGDRGRQNYENYGREYDHQSRHGQDMGYEKQPQQRYGYGGRNDYERSSNPRQDPRDYPQQEPDRRRNQRYENEGSYDNRQRNDRDYDPRSRRDDYQDRGYDDRSRRDRDRNSSHDDRRPRGRRHSREEPYESGRPDRNAKQHSRGPRREEEAEHPVEENIIEDTIFVSCLPLDATVSELAELFGSIGLIKIDKRTGAHRIKLYTHPDGRPKGEASVSYDDCAAARAAVRWYNQFALRGSNIKVQMAERTYSTSFINRRNNQNYGGGQRGGPRPAVHNEGSDFKSSRGSGPLKPSFVQPGDWVCKQCKNNNFKWREACNRCNAPKDSDPVGGMGHESHQSSAMQPPQLYPPPQMPHNPQFGGY